MLLHICDRCGTTIVDTTLQATVTVTFKNGILDKEKFADICGACGRYIVSCLERLPDVKDA
jgi:hypothetical protein